MTIKGVVTEPDSITPMPFVYVINSQTGLGQMSDGNGHFTIQASDKDSIIFSFIGYVRLKLPANKLYRGGYKESKVVMIETAYKLNQVIVSDFKLKPYEKDYMKRVIQGSKTSVINAMESPISALYMQFSQKGREQRKLAKIFEDIFIQEEVAKKLSQVIIIGGALNECLEDVEIALSYLGVKTSIDNALTYAASNKQLNTSWSNEYNWIKV